MPSAPHQVLASLRIWARRSHCSYKNCREFRKAVDCVLSLPYASSTMPTEHEVEIEERSAAVVRGVLLQKHLECRPNLTTHNHFFSL